MKLPARLFFATLVLFSALASFSGNPGEIKITSLDQALEQFADPPAAYRPAPLYTWNGDMQEDEIARQLDEFKAGGFGGVFVHPRPGLITPYLSKRWNDLWRFTADEAAKRGMVAYIYDENSYPSGFAGGHVPDQIPGSAQVSLKREELSGDQLNARNLDSSAIALYQIVNKDSGEYKRAALPKIEDGERLSGADLNLPHGDYILYSEKYPTPSPWYGGKTFVDLMRPDVTKRFLDVTFGAYDSAVSDLYGDIVLASFTDEPQVAGSWSPMIPPAFQARWGYDILDHLPSIHSAAGDWRKVRHDYSATILELFMQNFAQPYFDVCEERGIAFTGHVWEHGWPHLNHNPDIMSFYRWQHWPGIDCLMNQYSEGANAQFGNYRANKELDSIANQLGRGRRLCETYGAGGWDLTLEDVKRIGDHLYAGGVNLLNPHLSYYTIMGARKRDHPQSFSYHQPFWDAFHIPMDYFSRLSWALSAGKAQNPILIIQPTVTMWMYNWSHSEEAKLNDLGARFQSFITDLGASQVAFDLGSEPVMAELARVDGGEFKIGQCAYEAVILPPGLECLSNSTVKLLEEFAANGGTIVSYVGVPTYVDGVKSGAAQAVKKSAGDHWIETPLSAKQLATRWGNGGVMIEAQEPQAGRVYHFARKMDDGTLLFVINTSLDSPSNGTAEVEGVFAERWNAVSGTIEQTAFKPSGAGKVVIDFQLPPAGSALFAARNQKPNHALAKPQAWETKSAPAKPTGDIKITPLEPNVLTLDYVDYEAMGQSGEGVYFYTAQAEVYKAHGLDRNPWDSGVQFKDEIIKQDNFPPDSGFSFTYPFTLEGFAELPALEFVIERGAFYAVSINGHDVKPNSDEWRIDRMFRVYSAQPEWLKNGRNEIAIKAKPFSLHMEAEPVYVYGDFSLKSMDKGYAAVPPKPWRLGEWNQQGAPFYSNAVAYEQTFVVDAGDDSQRYVELGDWKGTAARVEVNGTQAGYILWQPFRLDISEFVKPGENTVSVEIIGSLKNLLGPHHAGHLRGSAWPSAFHENPKGGQPSGDAYDTIGYGLFEPFLVF